MKLDNDIEIRDAIKDIKVKVTSKYKMPTLALLDGAIIILKKMAKNIRDTNVSNQ